jgi:hypothetical protein
MPVSIDFFNSNVWVLKNSFQQGRYSPSCFQVGFIVYFFRSVN